MTAYRIDLLLSKHAFRLLVEQANINGQSLEDVAASIIGDNLEKAAIKRERDRRAMTIKLSREIGRPPPADPGLARQLDQRMLRQLAGIPDPLKQ
jgi:hypothetical protein